MVDYMEFDDVVKHVLADKTKLTIDGGCGPLEEGPGFGFEFGQTRMRVVEIRNGNDPVIDPHIWL